MINVPFFLLLYFICHNLLVSRSLYTVYSFERHRGCIWLYVFLGDRGPYVRSLNFTHFYFVILSSSSCPASLKCHPFKIENGIHFPFFLLLLNSIISRILRAVYHIMKYRQPCKPPTYYIFFLCPLSTEAYLSLFVFLGRQPWFLLASLPDAIAGYPRNGKQQ